MKIVILALIIVSIGCAHTSKQTSKGYLLEMSQLCASIKDGFCVKAKNSFSLSQDEMVNVFVRFSHVYTQPYRIVFEWYSPLGFFAKSEPVDVGDGKSFYQNVSLLQSMELQNLPSEHYVGKWHLLIKNDEKLLQKIDFELVQ